MSTVSCLLVPPGPPAIHGRQIVGIAVDLAGYLTDLFGGMTLPAMAATLADLPWFDSEDEGDPPGTMWWSMVNVVTGDGITQMHLQAEPARDGVAIYLPEIDGMQVGSAS